MIASLADHGIARTRWGSRPAGCFAARRASLVALALAALVGGCGFFGGPEVTVENRSPWRVDSLWVVTTADSTRVPTLAPGASARVRVRADGEDLLLLRGRASGNALAPSMGTYVEGGGRYRVHAVIGETGAVTITGTRVGAAY